MVEGAVLGAVIKEALEGSDLGREPGPESVGVSPLRTRQGRKSGGRTCFIPPSQSKAAHGWEWPWQRRRREE